MKSKKILKLILIALLFLGTSMWSSSALANCAWSTNKDCSSFGSTWATTTTLTDCKASNPGDVSCCCGPNSEEGCCEKIDKVSKNKTTKNLTRGECQNETYATTVFYKDYEAFSNKCLKKEVTNTTESKEEKKPLFIMPELQVKIPGLNLTPSSSVGYQSFSDGSYKVSIPWLAEYITGIYNYGLSIAGILAAIILMAGGLLWLISAGNDSKISKAKEFIAGGLGGLALLMFSYFILFAVNPELTVLKPIEIGTIAKEEFEGDNDSPSVSMDTTKIASTLGVNCGQDSVSEIITKSKGKATYSQENRTKSAPGGFVYLDCSSFAMFVLKCATGKNSDQNTASIFAKQRAWDQTLESLKPGDMVGWAPRNNKKQSGHVIIYMGNGIFGDCHGGSGKKPGNCISNSITFEKMKSYAKSHSDGKLYFRSY